MKHDQLTVPYGGEDLTELRRLKPTRFAQIRNVQMNEVAMRLLTTLDAFGAVLRDTIAASVWAAKTGRTVDDWRCECDPDATCWPHEEATEVLEQARVDSLSQPVDFAADLDAAIGAFEADAERFRGYRGMKVPIERRVKDDPDIPPWEERRGRPAEEMPDPRCPFCGRADAHEHDGRLYPDMTVGVGP